MADKMYNLYHGNVCEIYSNWPAPDLIISDGAYGVTKTLFELNLNDLQHKPATIQNGLKTLWLMLPG